MKIDKVIIWGHFLHSHTHSYIHNGFYEAFKYMGYNTYWFDDNSNIEGFDFSNSLFISEHQVDFNIPKREDCLYFIHFLERDRYIGVPDNNLINLKCAFRDTLRDKRQNSNIVIYPLNENNIEFYTKIDNNYVYYMIWATDIFPERIQQNIDNIRDIINERNNRTINFIGSETDPWRLVRLFCNRNGIDFIKKGASFNVNDKNNNKSTEENIELIQKSLIAPAFQDRLQVNDTYIPCRIFKNISYGRMGITNNELVNKIFDNKLIYNNDILTCIKQGIEFENIGIDNIINRVTELMYFVKENHTYINRVKSLCYFINNFTNFNII